MGEAKRRHEGNGAVLVPRAKIRVVDNVLLEDTDEVVMLMLGSRHPELGVAMTPEQARHLSQEIVRHAESVEARRRPTILGADGERLAGGQ